MIGARAGQLCAALVLLAGAWCGGPPLAGAGEGTDDLRVLFAIPPGAFSSYEVRIEETDAEPETLLVKLWRPAGGGAKEVALVLGPRRDSPSRLLFLDVNPRGLETDVRQELGLALGDVLEGLFAAVDGPASALEKLECGSRWSRSVPIAIALLPLSLEVDHRLEAAGEGRVLLGSRAQVPKRFSLLGSTLSIEAWEREIVAERATRRPISLKLRVETRAGSEGEGRTGRRVIIAEEKEHRRLSAAELPALESEIRSLREVDDAVREIQGRPRGGGFLAGLFGAPSPAAPKDPLALLDAYERTYPEGTFAAEARAMRATATERVEAARKARELEERVSKLVGSMAPDFTLEGLDGRKASLSEFRGKAVVLTFWGYG